MDRPTTHNCYALSCRTEIAIERPFCPRHWAMLPTELQEAVQAAREQAKADAKTGLVPPHQLEAISDAIRLAIRHIRNQGR